MVGDTRRSSTVTVVVNDLSVPASVKINIPTPTTSAPPIAPPMSELSGRLATILVLSRVALRMKRIYQQLTQLLTGVLLRMGRSTGKQGSQTEFPK